MENMKDTTTNDMPAKNVLTRASDWYKALPDKKRYAEFLTALLSIPIMITVLIINLNNLKPKDDNSQNTPVQIIITGNNMIPDRPSPDQDRIPTQGMNDNAPSPTSNPATTPIPTYTPYPTYTPIPTNPTVTVATSSAGL
jgi:hypothetical protein